jgi:uncharacterized membrane protein
MLAPQWRDARIGSMGEGSWKGIYSLFAIVGLALIIWGYAQARPEADILYVTPTWTRHIAILLMAFSFIAMMAFNLGPSRIKHYLQHPFLVSIKLWAAAHLLANGDSASVLLFGSFLVWAVWNRIAVSKRGGQRPAIGPVTNDLAATASGLLLWVLFIWKAHEWLFGVSPL